MIICFSCSTRLKQQMDSLLETEHYSDYGDLISAAVNNLAVLHSELEDRAALVIPDPERVAETELRHVPSKSKTRKRTSAKKKRVRSSLCDSALGGSRLPAHEAVAVEPASSARPKVFFPFTYTAQKGEVASLPDDVWGPKQTVPIERWVFGQYNRLLPAKVSCRALANLIASGKTNEVPEVALYIAKKAALLGQYLRGFDSATAAPRDEALATAFPPSGRRSEKGILRYANQFVGSTNKNGQLSGLLVSLKLANHANGSKRAITLTEPGWRFARLPNPALDVDGEIPGNRFSPDEISFLLEHVAEHVPAERFAYQAILQAVTAQHNAPEALDKALAHLCKQELSSSFLMSQRSGAVSRMSDLGLIERRRDGVRVEYATTERGQEFLASTCHGNMSR